MSTFPSYWPSSMARITSGAILNTKADTRACTHFIKYGKNPWKCYNLLSFSEFLKTLVCWDSSLVFGIYVSILVWQFFVCMTTSPPVYGMPLFTIKAAVNMWVNILVDKQLKANCRKLSIWIKKILSVLSQTELIMTNMLHMQHVSHVSHCFQCNE